MRRVIPTYVIDLLTRGRAATAHHRFHIVCATFLTFCALSNTASARVTATALSTGADTPARTQTGPPSQAVLDERLVAEFSQRADADMALQEKLQKHTSTSSSNVNSNGRVGPSPAPQLFPKEGPSQ